MSNIILNRYSQITWTDEEGYTHVMRGHEKELQERVDALDTDVEWTYFTNADGSWKTL